MNCTPTGLPTTAQPLTTACVLCTPTALLLATTELSSMRPGPPRPLSTPSVLA
jgi:hypothetical protein